MTTLRLRDATAADNAALIELTAACTMHGDVALRMDRSPDFFALNRLEGASARVGVVTDAGDGIVGCVAVARRTTYVNGVEAPITYASDLKVHPRARGSGAADLLTGYARDTATALCGDDAPVVCTVLAGNTAMERRARGPRGSAVLGRFATLAVHAIPLLWERREEIAGVRVRAATIDDLDAMAEAWRRRASSRQFADVWDADSLAAWIRRAPALSVEDYLIAFDRVGRVTGFLGIWDQHAFKQMRVVSYSPRLALARRAINLVTPLVGAVRLPEPGAELPALAAVHVCAVSPTTLRALLLAAYRRHRGGRQAFVTIGLDERDPLCTALRGLWSQPTRVNAYVSSGAGTADPATYAGRLLHHETALV